MKVASYEHYGDESSLRLLDIKSPCPKPGEVLIDVHATSINASDWEFLSGTPAYARVNGLRKPSKTILGSDISGVVIAVGTDVSRFAIGDNVFCDNFERFGGFAEQVVVPESKVIKKPKALSHIVASALPQSGVIALQALRKYGEVKLGDQVLINGAGGGAGSFAIQLAKQAGATVTAVDHANKLNFMTSLGADRVWDYQQQDITKSELTFDKVIDFVGHHSVNGFRRILTPAGTYVIVGGLLRDILGTLFLGSVVTLLTKKRMSILMHQQNTADILAIANLVESSALRCCVDKAFSLDDIQHAFRYFREQKVLGKIVVTMKGQ